MTKAKPPPRNAPQELSWPLSRVRCEQAIKAFIEDYCTNRKNAYDRIVETFIAHVKDMHDPAAAKRAYQRADAFYIKDSTLTNIANDVAQKFAGGRAQDFKRLFIDFPDDDTAGQILHAPRRSGDFRLSRTCGPDLLDESVSKQARKYNRVAVHHYALQTPGNYHPKRWDQLCVASAGATINNPDWGVVCMAVDMRQQAILLEEHIRPFLKTVSLEVPRGYSDRQEDRRADFLRELREETGWGCDPGDIDVVGRATPDNGKLVERVTYCLGMGTFREVEGKRFEEPVIDSHWVPLTDFYKTILAGPGEKLEVNGRDYEITDGFTLTGALLAMRKIFRQFPNLKDTLCL
ncbi:NUDIX hydrolase [Sphingobium sp. AN641]|uniref:NUDIX hydrolase n=1 Tax=Sphingobium sp. AN641 TaxID=3133443 RepID=UPI0030C4F1DD